MFIIEGAKMLHELLNSSFKLYAIYALDDYLASLQISGKLPENINIIAVTESELQKISVMRSPNKVLAVAYLPQVVGVGQPLQGEQKLRGSWLALDRIQDPGNMGTLIRIADWFGLKGILASPDSVEFYNPKVVQASMGSLFRVQLQQADLPGLLKKAPLPVYGALLEGQSIYQQTFEENGIILLGNESKGVAPYLLPYISHPVTIPRFGGAESLNVSVAAAIICSEIRRSKL